MGVTKFREKKNAFGAAVLSTVDHHHDWVVVTVGGKGVGGVLLTERVAVLERRESILRSVKEGDREDILVSQQFAKGEGSRRWIFRKGILP